MRSVHLSNFSRHIDKPRYEFAQWGMSYQRFIGNFSSRGDVNEKTYHFLIEEVEFTSKGTLSSYMFRHILLINDSSFKQVDCSPLKSREIN